MILFDISGSMRVNDPHRFSRMAAQLFLDLAHAQDAVGLIAFSDQAVTLVPLTLLASPEVTRRVQSRLMDLRFTGQTTDLATALEAGLDSFPRYAPPTSRDIVLLLTDGKLDLGRARRAEEPAALAHIRHTLLPRYRQRHIALYTIAFSPGADQALLREMAQTTRGEFRYITSPSQLHEAFGDLFILASQAESLPVVDDAFLLDDSIQEAELIFSKQQGQDPIHLITPQQKVLSEDHPSPGVRWTSTPTYDLVKLQAPEAGPWRLENPDGTAESIGIVGVSTLRLHVELHPTYREVGETLTIRAFLDNHSQRLQDPRRLQQLHMRAEVTTPQGDTQTLQLKSRKPGVYVGTLQRLDEAGQYSLRVIAASQQLRRQRTVSFTVYPECFQPEVTAGPPVMVRVSMANTCPVFDALTMEIGRSISDAPVVWGPLASPRPGVFTTTLSPPAPGQQGEITLRIRGQLQGEDPFTIIKGPWPLPASPSPLPESSSWKKAATFMVVKLLIINGVLLCLGGGGGGIYVYLKRRRRVLHV